jgi:adenine-specific DNA-methyltransferase
MTQTRRKLLESFDDEVREKLRIQDEASKEVLNRFEQLLMRLTRHELDGCAEFLNDSSFRLHSCPFAGEIPLGLYELPRRSGEAHTYRLHHPLADAVIAQAKGRELPMAEIKFNYGEHEGKVSILEPFRGRHGRLALSLCTIESLDQAEDHLIFAAVTDDGHPLDEEFAQRLLSLPGEMGKTMLPDSLGDLDEITNRRQAEIQLAISERNARLFEAEAEKLDGWADDLKLGLEREIKELDRQIKEARRGATAAPTLEEKLAAQKQIKALEAQRNEKRRSLFDAQDEVDRQRDRLITEIERKLQQRLKTTNLFTIRWSLS